MDCPIYVVAKDKGYLVNSTSGLKNSTWRNGEAFSIDFTNPEAASWWSNRLRDLLVKTGIDTFKFDAGESSWYVSIVFSTNMTYKP